MVPRGAPHRQERERPVRQSRGRLAHEALWGALDGEWIEFDSDGNEIEKLTNKDGVLVKELQALNPFPPTHRQ